MTKEEFIEECEERRQQMMDAKLRAGQRCRRDAKSYKRRLRREKTKKAEARKNAKSE